MNNCKNCKYWPPPIYGKSKDTPKDWNYCEAPWETWGLFGDLRLGAQNLGTAPEHGCSMWVENTTSSAWEENDGRD